MDEIIRVFTGPSRLSEDQVEWVEDEINNLREIPAEVRTGCADGLDTIAAGLQWSEYPNARHLLFVPSAYHNDKFVAYLSGHKNVEVIRCPRRTQTNMAYRTRNEYMLMGQAAAPERGSHIMRVLAKATVLEAFLFSSEYYRSGEWMTVNIAIKHRIPVGVHIIPKEG